jgi:peptide/nickel transport system substrate-binding protein
MRKEILALGAVLLLAACMPGVPTLEPADTPTSSATQKNSSSVTPAAGSGQTTAQASGSFREAITTDAVSFHPYQTTDAASRAFQDKVYASGLWLRDPKTLQTIPGLAESWTTSSDGKTFTFALRKDLKWSDGTPLTAEDFVWTFEQATKPENKYPYVNSLDNIISYRAKDDYTLEVGVSDVTCTALTTVDAITPLPKHIWSKLDWNDSVKNPEIRNPSVVSGPYRLKEWQRGDHADFVRNDTYYRGAPNIETDSIRIVPEAAKQFQMLKAGEVDVAPVSAADYAEASKLSNLKLYEWAPATPDWDYIGFNLRRPFLKNVLVRQALAYAIPRDKIVTQAFGGQAKPMFSIFPPTSSFASTDVQRYDYNIDTAKATLQKAGYKLDPTGKLLDKDGKAIPKLKIYYNTGSKPREQIAKIAQEEFKKLGLDSDVVGLEFLAYLDYLKKAPFDFDLFILGWHTPSDPYFSLQMWSEANIPTLNPAAYVNKEIEKMFDQSNLPPCDLVSRKKVFAQIQKLVSTEEPYIFLTYRTGYAFVNKRIVPNEPSPLGIAYAPEQWSTTGK